MNTITLSGVLSVVLGACSTVAVAGYTMPQAPLPPSFNLRVENLPTGPANDSAPVIYADAGSKEGGSLGSAVVGETPARMNLRQESDLVFNILSGEIAGRRGLVGIASENYFDASESTDDPRVTERAVKLALYASEWDRADLAAARWVLLEPGSVEAWQHRAQASIQKKDVDTATAAIGRVVDLSSGAPGEVIPSVVDSILRQSDPNIGMQLLERLAASYPDNADTQYGIGRFAMSQGQREIALRAFERALSIDPDNVETLLSRARLHLSAGKGDAALEPVVAYLERSPDDLSAQLGHARLLMDTGKVDRAADQFDVIHQRFPTDADALYTIGLLALDIRRVKSAETYLSAVAKLDKHQDNAHFYLGRISDSRRDYKEAIGRYTRVQGGENFFQAQGRAGELHGLVGEIAEGRELFAELKTFTDERAVLIGLINSETRMLNGNDLYEESMVLLNDGLEKYQADPELLYSRALVAERLDKRDVFEADLKTVIEVQPENSYALNALGYFLVDRNERLSEAEGYLTKAYEITPEDPAIIDSLGWLYYRQGRYFDSLKLLKEAYALLPDSEIAAHLGEVLWVSGDQENAAKVWEEALRAAPDDDLLNSVMKKYIR